MWALALLFVPVIAITIQKVSFKSNYPIGRYEETRFSYHENGMSVKPSDYPTSPKVLKNN